MGILPGTNQECLGRSPVEHGQIRVIIPGNGYDSGHWESLPWKLHQWTGGRDHLVGREGVGARRVVKETVGGVPQAPTVCLLLTSEVNPTGVGICKAVHPRHRGRLCTSREGPQGHVYAETLPGHRVGNYSTGVQPPASKTGRSGPPGPDKDGPWELDGVLCYHRTSSRSVQGTEGVYDGIPRQIYVRGEVRGDGAKRNVVDRGTGGDPGGCLCPSHTPLAVGDEDGGMADGAAVNSKWDETGCAGMARWPLPEILPRDPRPLQVLWLLQRRLINTQYPWLQEGRPSHGLSQWYQWRGRRPGRQSLYSNARAWLTPHICRLRRVEAKGTTGRVHTPTIKTEAIVQGT